MIEPIGAIESIQTASAPAEATTAKGASSFVDWFDGELTKANSMINEANTQVQRFAAGENVPVHQLMLALEEARLSFQIVSQIRNRLLEGYQEVMRMQI